MEARRHILALLKAMRRTHAARLPDCSDALGFYDRAVVAAWVGDYSIARQIANEAVGFYGSMFLFRNSIRAVDLFNTVDPFPMVIWREFPELRQIRRVA